jgi:glutathione synthase/RimK-type ligase-like ATP-grasp enzyme
MILVISHPDDLHATSVLDILAAEGHETLLMNAADLPGDATLVFRYDGESPALEYRRAGGPSVDLTGATATWYRRPQSPDLSSILDPDVLQFTHNEWQEALNGAWLLIEGPWMNHPRNDEAAARKALQLKVAAEVGLRIPHTVITSDPAVARQFVSGHGIGRTVYKTFSCTHAIWRETRLVGEPELELMESVRLAPVTFQEYIAGGPDIRATVVGGEVFAAAIDVRDTSYAVDFRMALGEARTEPIELPDELKGRLLKLMHRLGLVYGAIDLRRAPDGDYVFFEVNTAGEFLFVEERTGLPISRAIAGWLARPS